VTTFEKRGGKEVSSRDHAANLYVGVLKIDGSGLPEVRLYTCTLS